jgi:hypothetical protein
VAVATEVSYQRVTSAGTSSPVARTGIDGEPGPRQEVAAGQTANARKPELAQIGEAAARRHTAPIASMMLWAAFCGSILIALHKLSADWAARQGSYCTGLMTLATLLVAALYAVRKYTLWFSLRYMRVASRLPKRWAVRLLLVDRLETWRVAHITLGVFVMLPFWWHTQFGRRSALELALEILVVVMVLCGFLSTLIEDFLPVRMLKLGNQEVRVEDVEAASQKLYVEAEELVLGHSEALVHSYLLEIRPVLAGSQPSGKLLWATLGGKDIAPGVCRSARLLANGFGAEASAFHELVNIAEHKVRLDHNAFNLMLTTNLLRLHRSLAITVLVLIIFHVAGVLYFAGI